MGNCFNDGSPTDRKFTYLNGDEVFLCKFCIKKAKKQDKRHLSLLERRSFKISGKNEGNLEQKTILDFKSIPDNSVILPKNKDTASGEDISLTGGSVCLFPLHSLKENPVREISLRHDTPPLNINLGAEGSGISKGTALPFSFPSVSREAK